MNRPVGAAHLQSCVNAYAFRYNHRKDAGPIFRLIEGRVAPPRRSLAAREMSRGPPGVTGLSDV